MAEPPSKRQREEDHDHPHVATNQRPYDDMILSLLEDDEEVPCNLDLSSFITSLQREIENPVELSASSSFNKEDANESTEEDQEDMETIMQRLLEASDDELGLPSRDEGVFCEGLWEIENLLHQEEEGLLI